MVQVESVLYYDDYFHQLQAMYNIPWVFESHHLNTVRLIPLAMPRNMSTGWVVIKRSATLTLLVLLLTLILTVSYMQVYYTADGRETCRMFNDTSGCTILIVNFPTFVISSSMVKLVDRTTPITSMAAD